MGHKKVDCTYIKIEDIDLDYDNPRIARVLEMYSNRNDISAEQISLALGTDGGDSSHTTFTSLRESIRTNGGIIHPIIVNQIGKRYIVIEGNTRVQIYKDFANSNVPGDWNEIMAVIYTNLSEQDAHAIRLQSHLVGPRDWDPYSKAKYLYLLYNQEKLPFAQIVDFCGGDRNKTLKYIKAYEDMENHYRPQLESENDFDAEKFSAFIEYQNGNVKQSIIDNGYSIDDFSSWIISEKIPQLAKIRQLPMVLANQKAKAAFINGTIDDGIRYLDVINPIGTPLKEATLDQLAAEISKRIREMTYETMKAYKISSAYTEKKANIFEAFDQLKEFCDDISTEE
jgi:hypothetical protein